MKAKLLLSFVPLFLCLFFSNFIKAQINSADSLALVDFYHSTNGAGWLNHSNWLTKKPVSTWYGITVSNNRVTQILTFENNLTGSLPASLGNLTELNRLYLPENSIGGAIPSSLGNLVKLGDFSLNSNALTGQLPATLGNLTSLTTFNVDNNQLSGEIPSSFQNLVHLIGFNVSGNAFSGSFPQAVLSMKGLFTLALSNNHFSGPLPAEIGGLNKMHFLYLDHNGFSGSIPEVFGDWVDVQQLYFGSNQFTGGFPTSMRSLPSLFVLNIDHNQLSGTLPSWLGEMENLYGLDVSYNNFTGQIPASIKKYPRDFGFLVFNFSHNHFTLHQNLPFSKKNVWYEADISYNNFNFNIESLVKAFRAVGILTYAPQANLPLHQHGNQLAVSGGGYLTDNIYTWFRVGSADSVTIAEDSTFTPTVSGSYYAKVKNLVASDLTLYTDTISYTKTATLAISVSPNPARDMIRVDGLDETTDSKITVADMSGFVWVSAMSRKQLSMKLDVSRLKAGIYTVTINNNRDVKTGQFIKE